MAQREGEQIEIHVHETLILCVNNCGFFGNPATKNLCHPCFKRASNSARSQVPPMGAGEKEDKIDGTVATAEPPAAAPVARKVNQCLVCRKRVGLVGFRCRCGDLFCGQHRYSDRHGCGFDYKAAARAAIARANPVVRSAKIVRF